MDSAAAWAKNPGSERSIMRAAVSTARDRPSKPARIGSLSDSRHLVDIPVPYRQDVESEEVEVDKLVIARDAREGVVLPGVWENPEGIAYVRQRPRI